jgi:hypothetical protein
LCECRKRYLLLDVEAGVHGSAAAALLLQLVVRRQGGELQRESKREREIVEDCEQATHRERRQCGGSCAVPVG